MRTDWARPLGAFTQMSTMARLSYMRGEPIHWNSVSFRELWLGHQASLLLLQGMPLSKLLVPNHQLEHPSLDVPLRVAHVILRVDPWEYWLPRPRLTNLMVATLPRELPPGLSPSEILAALAFDSAS